MRAQSDGGMDMIKRQLGALEVKVNRILELLSQKAESLAPKPSVTEKVSKVEKATKAKALTRKTGAKGKK